MCADVGEALSERVLAGDKRGVARAISVVEDERAGYEELLAGLQGHVGRAHRIGVTGPPGAGKSTLVEALVRSYRDANRTVGVVAVDPTSPFTGGALLGDRVRMTSLAGDPGVFVRSMASRGNLGGLSLKTLEVVDVLDASGKDVVVIETVGVGQSEVQVAEAADTTVVVVSPESGDGIQAMKAGLMEIAQIYCVNKADRAGTDAMCREIVGMMELIPKQWAWKPPVLKSIAVKNEGIGALREALDAHAAHLRETGALDERRARQTRDRLRELVERRWRRAFWTPERLAQLDAQAQAVQAGTRSALTAAQELLD